MVIRKVGLRRVNPIFFTSTLVEIMNSSRQLSHDTDRPIQAQLDPDVMRARPPSPSAY